ncbi:hypothetical protein X801_10175, partial [Opisthorchis viverrini]
LSHYEQFQDFDSSVITNTLQDSWQCPSQRQQTISVVELSQITGISMAWINVVGLAIHPNASANVPQARAISLLISRGRRQLQISGKAIEWKRQVSKTRLDDYQLIEFKGGNEIQLVYTLQF